MLLASLYYCYLCFLLSFPGEKYLQRWKGFIWFFSNRSPSTSGHILKGNPRLRFHHFDSVSTFVFTTHLSNHGAKNWLPNEKWFIQMEGCFGVILLCLNITDSFVYYLTVKDTHQGVVWDFFFFSLGTLCVLKPINLRQSSSSISVQNITLSRIQSVLLFQ